LLRKLREESVRDTAVALERMPLLQRKALRVLAEQGLFPDNRDEVIGDFISLLCETGPSPLKLLSPYGALLRSWVTCNGSLAISSEGSRLAESVTRNLAAIFSFYKQIPSSTLAAASKSALEQLARNGVGVDQPGLAQGTRVPCTVEELRSIPAVRAILGVLNREAKDRNASESHSATQLSKVQESAPDSALRIEFMKTAGLSIILWIRHVEAHVFFITDELPRAGLSSAVVQEMVEAALDIFVQDSSLGFSLNDMGVLCKNAGKSPLKE